MEARNNYAQLQFWSDGKASLPSKKVKKKYIVTTEQRKKYGEQVLIELQRDAAGNEWVDRIMYSRQTGIETRGRALLSA